MKIINGNEISILLGEARRLEKTSGWPLYTLIYTVIHTGLRRGELLALRWTDLDLDMATISVTRSLQCLKEGKLEFREPKTSRSKRLIAMTPSLATELRKHRVAQEAMRFLHDSSLAQNDLVFSRPNCSPINPNNVSPAFAKTARRAGLNIRFHDLRHTHASLMLEYGVHPKIVSERLGHSTVAFTLDFYSHLVPGFQEAAALAFDENLKNAMQTVEEHDSILSNR